MTLLLRDDEDEELKLLELRLREYSRVEDRLVLSNIAPLDNVPGVELAVTPHPFGWAESWKLRHAYLIWQKWVTAKLEDSSDDPRKFECGVRVASA